MSAASTAISAAAGIANKTATRGKLIDRADSGPFGNGSPDEPPDEHAERDPNCTADDRERDRLPRHSRADVPPAEAERPEDTEVARRPRRTLTTIVWAIAMSPSSTMKAGENLRQPAYLLQFLDLGRRRRKVDRAAVVTQRTHPFVDGISCPFADADTEHLETVGRVRVARRHPDRRSHPRRVDSRRRPSV